MADVLKRLEAHREPDIFRVYAHILGVLSGQHVFACGLTDDVVFSLGKSELVVQDRGRSDMYSPEISSVPCWVCLYLVRTQLRDETWCLCGERKATRGVLSVGAEWGTTVHVGRDCS